MNPIFLIPVTLIIDGIIFMVTMNKKHKDVQSEIEMDKERIKYKSYKQELLNSEFLKIQKWMNEKPIDTFTLASTRQSTTSKVKEHITDGLKKNNLLKVDNEYIDILSENDLPFFITNTLGKENEDITFDCLSIEKVKLIYRRILKSTLGLFTKSTDQYLLKINHLTIDVDGNPITNEIHDRLNYVIAQLEILNIKNNLKLK